MSSNLDHKDKLDLEEIGEESVLIITTKKTKTKIKKFKIIFSITFILLNILLNIFSIKICKKFNGKLLDFPEKMVKNKIPELIPTNDKKKRILNKDILYKSRKIFINDKNITKEYIQYIKPINNDNNKNNKKVDNLNINFYDYKPKKKIGQFSVENFYQICQEEILIDRKKYELPMKPKISIIIPVFNKKKDFLKSLRSIQNQSFKSIEIIIVDDGSTDSIDELYKNLLKNEPRIRIFKHSKNMGVWRSRLDGYLYSKGEYILHFDPGDMYADNYVLEDAYNLIIKYNLDTVRFSFSKTNIHKFEKNKKFESMNIYPSRHTEILYSKPSYDVHVFGYGTIWNRLVRANIFSKALELVDEYILNAYKNLWEDMWWNDLIDRVSFSNLIVNRLGYLYLVDDNGVGKPRLSSKQKRDKTIKEFIYFWFFDFQLLPKEDNKKTIIQNLYKYNNRENKFCQLTISLNYLTSKFPIYERLLVLLYNDPFVERADKKFIFKLYSNYMQNQKN